MNKQSDNRPYILTKFDVAERQLLQAIKMFFSKEDSVSIHTLSEAAGQVLYDIGKSNGVISLTRDCELIKPERKKEWLTAVFKSRNFFKHADNDAAATHEFRAVFNDFSLFDTVNMYTSIKKCWTPETLLFLIWFGHRYPELFNQESEFISALERIRHINKKATSTDKAFIANALTKIRSGKLVVPNITLEFGLQKE